MMNSITRNRYLDIVKGILILIVTFRHVFQIAADNSNTDYLCNLMASVEMPLFIAISGYFSLPKLFDSAEGWSPLNKFKRICFSYLLPFFSYFIIFRLFFYSRYEGIKSLVSWVYNITESLWYLFAIWVLNLFSIVSFLITKNIASKTTKVLFFVLSYFALICGFLVVGLVMGIYFLGCKLIVYYSAYYLLGYLFLNFQDCIFSIFHRFKEPFVFVCAFIYFIGAYKIKVMVVPDTFVFIILRVILALTGIVAILSLSYNLYKTDKCKFLEIIGINSLEIYYVHSFLLNSLHVDKAEALMSTKGLVNSGVLSVYILVLCIAIIFIIKSNTVLSFVLFGKKYKK